MRLPAIGLALVLAGCQCGDATPPVGKKPAPQRSAPISAAKRPSLPPAHPRTVVAWSVAESNPTAATWDLAAEAYERELEDCADDCRETVYAIVLARRNAMMAEPVKPPEGDQPVPVPPRVQKLVDALDHYAAVGDPADPDVAGVKFLAANALNKWRQPDAVERFETVIREHGNAEVAEYAANLLLDKLMRQNRMTELRAWVDRMLADAVFLSNKPALRATLETLRERLASL